MFTRLRALFDGKPRVGDLVTVLNGPYAGKAGTITAVQPGNATVFIDDCCQPTLADESLRRTGRGRGGSSEEFGPPDAGVDQDYEEARSRIRQIPPSDFV